MAPHPMSSYEARRATFIKAEGSSTGRAASSRRAAAASHARQPSWPHPLPDGSSSSRTRIFPSAGEMANLGLYFVHHATASSSTSAATASAGKDACALYPEDHIVISDWRGGDDAAERIRALEPTAAFLLITESKDKLEQSTEAEGTWLSSSAELLPTGKTMIDARVRTFGTSWPYDGKKGWKPTSKKLAQAGFHYTPNEDEDDCATCQYCDVSLGGWEKTDDPVHEHQRRRPECAFFNCTLKQVSPSTSNSTVKGKSTSTGHKRTKSASSKRKATSAEEAEVAQVEQLAAEIKVEAKDAKTKASDNGDTSTNSKRSIPPAAVVPPARTSSRKKAKVDEEIAPHSAEEVTTTAPAHELGAAQKEPAEAPVVVQATEEKSTKALEEHKETLTRSRTGSTSEPQSERRKTDATIKNAPTEQEEQPAQPELPIAEAVHPVTSPAPAGIDMAIVAGSTDDMPIVEAVSEPPRIAVPPLPSLAPLTAADEEMSVEAWLKQQVKQACDEMEKEGMRRIDSLRDAMTRNRGEIEAILRGQHTSSNPNAVSVA